MRYIFLAMFSLALAPLGLAQQAENTTPLSDGIGPLSVLNSPVELPRVLLTPPVTAVEGLEVFRLDLSGTWDFAYERPVPFFGKAEQVETWSTVELPGHFAFQGYEPLKNELGRAVVYRKTFEVPADWADRAVMLRFGSIDGLVKLWVNQRPVGSSDSAFLPVEFDVSPYIRAGQANEISVSVEVSDLTAWYLRELGGMGRPVTLTALPTTYLSRLHVETPADPTHDASGHSAYEDILLDNATRPLRVSLSLANISDQPGGAAKLKCRVLDHEGNAVTDPIAVSIASIPSGDEVDLDFTLSVSHAELWDPEHPNLYALRVTLLDDTGRPIMTAQRPFGFRSVAIDRHQLLVNGRPIKIAGANYHVTQPGYGHFPPGDLIRRDLEILKDANLNALRAWPTPYREYIDACNELGLFTTIEVPINLQLYAPGPRKDHGNNPALDQPYLHLAARVVETYRSDPSVLMWGLANESIYYDYFQRAAVAIRQSDPTRPLFFGGDGRMGVNIPGVQINDEHYPRSGTTSWSEPGNIQHAADEKPPFGWQFPNDKPAISSEWLHLNINNRAQFLLDPGVDDYWGIYAKAHQDWTWRTPQFVGGFTFLAAPYRGLESKTQWRGFFDDDRRPTPYLWHIHKASSPVQLDTSSIKPDTQNNEVRFTLTNRFNFTDFDEVRFVLQQGDAQWTLPIRATAHESVTVNAAWDPDGPPLRMTAFAPDGREIDRFVIVDAPPVLPPINAVGSVSIVGRPELPDHHGDGWIINTGHIDWRIDPKTGLINAIELGDQASYAVAGPRLTVRGHGHPNPGGKTGNLSELCRGWTLDTLDVKPTGDSVRVLIRGTYDYAEGQFELIFMPGDQLLVEYEFTWTWPTKGPFNLFDQGIAFTLPATFDTLTWARDALWTAYPEDHIGRPHGTAPAFGEPRWIEKRDDSNPNALTQPMWPWSQDRTGPPSSDGQVTRDFRATRTHFRHGGLIDDQGQGLFAISDGSQHLRALPAADTAGLDTEHDSFTLQANDYFEGGSDYHSSKSLYVERRKLSEGTQLSGKSSWRWITPETHAQ